MSSRVASHLYCKRHGTPSFKGRSWIVAAAVFALMGVALYSGVFLWDRANFDWALIEFFTFAGLAVAYGFGFLWYFPDVVTQAPLDTNTLCRRWSDFSLLTAFVTLIGTNIAYARSIWVNLFFISLPRALVILAASAWLLSACVAASGNYLSWTLPSDSATAPSSWLARRRYAIKSFGGWLIAAVRGKRSLIIGASLVLASLLLPVRVDPWDWHATGYQAVLGRHSDGQYPVWREIPWPDLVVGQGRRLVYILVLGIAVAALVISVFLPHFSRRRAFPFLTIIAGSVTFFEVVDLRPGAYEIPVSVVPILWIFACLLPITLWLVLVHGIPERSDRVRLSLMLFGLPVFLVGFSFLPVWTYLSVGQGALILGMLLLWWGLLQQEEARS